MPYADAEDARQRWDAVAGAYAAKVGKLGDVSKEVLLTPTLLDLVGDVAGKHVLDAGCGDGFLSRLLAERGASVRSIDCSQNMVDIARKRTPAGMQVRYEHANMERLESVGTASCDLVVSCLAIQDVVDYESAVCEFRRVLIDNAYCVLALLHPCFSSDGGWVRDEAGEKLHWKVDNYFHEGPREQQLFPDSADLPAAFYFHRTLTSYFRAFKRAGFLVDEFVEAVPSAGFIAEHPNWANDLRMCHFLAMRLRAECQQTGRGDAEARAPHLRRWPGMEGGGQGHR